MNVVNELAYTGLGEPLGDLLLVGCYVLPYCGFGFYPELADGSVFTKTELGFEQHALISVIVLYQPAVDVTGNPRLANVVRKLPRLPGLDSLDAMMPTDRCSWRHGFLNGLVQRRLTNQAAYYQMKMHTV